jgi:acyl-CoA thioester hydrolase
MIKHTSHIRVRYAETDQMHMAYYARYLDYFEVARTEMLRAKGIPYRSFEDEGYLLPVLEAHVNYLQSARYDDELRIETALDFPGGAVLHIEYKITREGQPIATGHTRHAFIRASSGKPCRPPKRFMEAMGIA